MTGGGAVSATDVDGDEPDAVGGTEVDGSSTWVVGAGARGGAVDAAAVVETASAVTGDEPVESSSPLHAMPAPSAAVIAATASRLRDPRCTSPLCRIRRSA